jgi:hypothetical protein
MRIKFIWKGWKKDEFRSRLFAIGTKEKEILVEAGTDRRPNP